MDGIDSFLLRYAYDLWRNIFQALNYDSRVDDACIYTDGCMHMNVLAGTAVAWDYEVR